MSDRIGSDKDVCIVYSCDMAYREDHYSSGRLMKKGVWKIEHRFGYHKVYYPNGIMMLEGHTGYWIDGDFISEDNEEGYCYIWDRLEV